MSTWLLRTHVLLALTEYERAAHESARTAVALAPEESDAHVLVGVHHTRDYRVSQQAYETALRLDPDNSTAHNNLSLLLLRRRWLRPGSWTRAAEGFVQSAALDRDDRHGRYNLERTAGGTLMGSRWVAFVGSIAVALGSTRLAAVAGPAGPAPPAPPHLRRTGATPSSARSRFRCSSS
ncbi:tetratricopeptide repeat protein [Streptomyces sp. NPDC098789]|uniref:tetratricopeptide repeat protein n=1 Tax=Streptomyces sp. NPDC098789 TaxID=3366098 RepID=UPI00381C4063